MQKHGRRKMESRSFRIVQNRIRTLYSYDKRRRKGQWLHCEQHHAGYERSDKNRRVREQTKLFVRNDFADFENERQLFVKRHSVQRFQEIRFSKRQRR